MEITLKGKHPTDELIKQFEEAEEKLMELRKLKRKHKFKHTFVTDIPKKIRGKKRRKIQQQRKRIKRGQWGLSAKNYCPKCGRTISKTQMRDNKICPFDGAKLK